MSRCLPRGVGQAKVLPLALILVLPTMGVEHVMHTDAAALTAMPVYHALHFLGDSLLVLPLAAAAVWAGLRTAARLGLYVPSLSASVARALVMAVVFALILVPGSVLHAQADALTHTQALRPHLAAQWPAPAGPLAMTSFVSHALVDSITGQVIALPLLIVFFWRRKEI